MTSRSDEVFDQLEDLSRSINKLWLAASDLEQKYGGDILEMSKKMDKSYYNMLIELRNELGPINQKFEDSVRSFLDSWLDQFPETDQGNSDTYINPDVDNLMEEL